MPFSPSTNYPRPEKDGEHGPDKVNDGDKATYWASQGFDMKLKTPVVFFDVSFEAPETLERLEIDWEFPPLSYSVQSRVTGAYTQVRNVPVNSMNSTRLDLNVRAKDIRLALLKPHPDYAVSTATINQPPQRLFGIRELRVLKSGFRSVLGHCDEITEDLRDRIIPEIVQEKPSTSGHRLALESSKMATGMGKLSSRMAMDSSGMEACLDSTRRRLDLLKTFSGNARVYESFLAKFFRRFPLLKGTKEYSTLPPTCEDVPKGVTGYYDIAPACAPESVSVRALCLHYKALPPKFPSKASCLPHSDVDVDPYRWGLHGDPTKPGKGAKDSPLPEPVASSVFFVPVTKQVHQTLLSKNLSWPPLKYAHGVCALKGLTPFVPRSSQALETVRDGLLQTGHLSSGLSSIPILVGNGEIYTDLNGKGVSNLQNEHFDYIGHLPAAPSTSVVVYLDEFSLQRAELARSVDPLFSLVVCEIPPLTSRENISPIGCETNIRYSSLFQGPIGAEVNVRCPTDCPPPFHPVTGGDSIFRDDSPICTAAVFEGLLPNIKVIKVTILAGQSTYPSQFRNGVKTESYDGAEWDRSIKLSAYSPPCPSPDDLTEKDDARFEQLSKEQTLPEVPERLSLESITSTVSESLVMGTSADPRALDVFMQESRTALSSRLEVVKEVETKQKEVESLSSSVLKTTRALFDKMVPLASKMSVLFQATDLKKIESRALLSRITDGRRPLSHPPWPTTALLGDQVLHWAAKPQDVRWEVTDGQLALTSQVIVDQRGLEQPASPAPAIVRGAKLLLRDRDYFNFEMKVRVFSGSGGSWGIGFHMASFSDGYVVELSQRAGGYTRLLRLARGLRPVELFIDQNGGFESNEMVDVSVKYNRGHIEVSSPLSTFNVFDNNYPRGRIMIVNEGTQGGKVLGIRSRSSPCSSGCHPDADHAPLPKTCSIVDTLSGQALRTTYRPFTSLSASMKALPRWGLADAGGRRSVVVQFLHSGERYLHPGEVTTLLNHIRCASGTISVDVRPVGEGQAGVALNVVEGDGQRAFDAIMVSQSRLAYSRWRGMPWSVQELKAVDLPKNGRAPSVTITVTSYWRTMTIQITPPKIRVVIGETDLDVADVGRLEGNVGLITHNCGGCAFDRVTLAPADVLAERAKLKKEAAKVTTK
ncbi:MAG: uncharacterized protein KVP18_000624 [Porospora cf. gigantea A]|uniref:uncharacterized protein n=1 Tax=Porospora cf. gigantea A TaxID=2853593 RepID=UPI00355A28B7|nr:MAG: hypothetical protein KVP18_000624 [Porospora cf. gigantea A]